MTQVPIDHAMRIALDHHQRGRTAQARAIYQRVLSAQPNHAEALNLLGLLAAGAGHADDAIDLVRRAVAASPDNPAYHFHLGTLLQTVAGRTLAAFS